MITIKLPYSLNSDSDRILISEIQRQYSATVRSAYNRFHEGKKQIEVRSYCRNLNNIKLLNSWLIQTAVLEGKQIQTRFKDTKVVFGGSKNFNLRVQDKLSKEEFKLKRLVPISSQGEILHKGNRMFDFSKLSTENKIVFKVNKSTKVELKFPKQQRNYKEKLNFIETLTATKDLTVSVRLSDKFIYLSYEEPKKLSSILSENRYLGIDLNPNYIGVSVFEDLNGDRKVIHTETFDFTKLTSQITSEANASDSVRYKHLNNKLKHETLEVSKAVSNLALKFNCKFVFYEDLKKIDKGDAGLGIKFNRLTRNLWKRSYFTDNLIKRCSLYGIKSFKVNPMYSSVIGNLTYNYFDPSNAACEVARRGYEVIILKNKKFYPDFTIKHTKADQWKEYGLASCKDWKETFKQVKNAKVRYRVPLKDSNVHKSLQMKSKRTKVVVHKFDV